MTDLTKVVAGQNARENLVQHEAPAAAATRAGHLVEQVDGGVQPHSSAAGTTAEVLVALDARGRGYEVGDEYAADENLPYGQANAGVELTMFLSAGETVTGGDNADSTYLVSDGAGALQAFVDGTDDPDAIVAKAAEDLDNGSGTDEVALAVEVMR